MTKSTAEENIFIKLYCPQCETDRHVKRKYWQNRYPNGDLNIICRKCCDSKARTHGQSGTRLYSIWKHIKQRCHNPGDKQNYAIYGAKGIKVCDEWRYDFIPFWKWAEEFGGYDAANTDLQLDRINPYGNYEPSNCQFISKKENQTKEKRKPEAA